MNFSLLDLIQYLFIKFLKLTAATMTSTEPTVYQASFAKASFRKINFVEQISADQSFCWIDIVKETSKFLC